MNWTRLDDYCLLAADGRYTIAATFDATHVVYIAYRIDQVPVGRRIEKRSVMLETRRAAIDDRPARNEALRALQAVCSTDQQGAA